MKKHDKELYLTKKITVNYVSTNEHLLETIINRIVFFEYNRHNKILAIYLKGTSLKSQKQLVEEIIDIEITNGSELRKYATNWYRTHLEELLTSI